MDTYLHLPAIRFTRPAFRIAVYLSAVVTMFNLIILGIKTANMSLQSDLSRTGGIITTDMFNTSGIALAALFIFASALAIIFVVNRDEKSALPFQRDGRDKNRNGSRKWVTMPSNQFSLAAAALMPAILMASSSGSLGFMKFTFYTGMTAIALTIPAVALVRTLMFRAEQRTGV